MSYYNVQKYVDTDNVWVNVATYSTSQDAIRLAMKNSTKIGGKWRVVGYNRFVVWEQH